MVIKIYMEYNTIYLYRVQKRIPIIQRCPTVVILLVCFRKLIVGKLIVTTMETYVFSLFHLCSYYQLIQLSLCASGPCVLSKAVRLRYNASFTYNIVSFHQGPIIILGIYLYI